MTSQMCNKKIPKNKKNPIPKKNLRTLNQMKKFWTYKT